MEYEECDILIDADGTIQTIYDDDVAELFAGEQSLTRRVSNVEPYPGGGWVVDLSPVGGPKLYELVSPPGAHPRVVQPFRRRADALATEVAWLRERMMQQRVEVNAND